MCGVSTSLSLNFLAGVDDELNEESKTLEMQVLGGIVE